MSRIFVSLSSSWTKFRDRPEHKAAYIVGLPFLVASLVLLTGQRTFIGSGAGPNPAWLVFMTALIGWSMVFAPDNKVAVPWATRLLVCLAPVIPFVEVTVQVGIVLAALSGLAAWFPRPNFQRWAFSFAVGATLWLVASMVYGVYGFAVPRFDLFSYLAVAVNRLLAAFGMIGSLNHGVLHVLSDHTAHRAIVSEDKLGGPFPLVFLATLLPLVKGSYRWRGVLVSIGATALYVLGRALWVVITLTSNEIRLPWWTDERLIVTYTPLLMLVFLVLRLVPSPQPEAAPVAQASKPSVLRTALWPALGVLGTILVVVGWSWEDPGTLKHGTVMIDESCSRWEWSEVPIDTHLYGVKTVYNYYNMMEELAKTYTIARNFSPISDATLKGVSVLILKTPTAAYSSESLTAMDRFVKRGGGLWLIGDHTDIFGMDTYLNSVVSRYGTIFESDAAVDAATNRQVIRLASYSHPIVRRMPTFLYYTSCSVRPSVWARDVIVSDHMLVDRGDFSSNTFFGNFTPDPDERIGPVIQASAQRVGRGRVALWSDSTLFSNFSIFLPGKMELADGFVDWLNRSDNGDGLRYPLMLVGFLCLGFALARTGFIGVSGFVWAGVAAGCSLAAVQMNAAYPVVPRHQTAPLVAFLEGPAGDHLPVTTPPSTDEASPGSYLSVFLATQRLGQRPFVTFSVDEACKAPTMVIFHSHLVVSDDELAQLKGWIRRGGHLVIFDGGVGDGHLLNGLLDGSAMGLVPFRPDVSPRPKNGFKVGVFGREGNTGTQMVDVALAGGKPIFRDPVTTQALMSTVPIGKGKLTVSVTRGLFSDLSLGDSSSIPNLRQRALYDEIYEIFGGPAKGK